MTQTTMVTNSLAGDMASRMLFTSAAQAFDRQAQRAAAPAKPAANGLWATAVWGTKSWGTEEVQFPQVLAEWAVRQYGMRLTVAGRSWETIN